MNKYIKIAIIVVGLIGLVAIGWFGRGYIDSNERNAAINSARSIVEQIDSNKTSDAYKQAGVEFKATVSNDNFKESTKVLSSTEYTAGEIQEVYEGYEDYIVIYEILDKNNKQNGALSIYMAKEDNNWVFRNLVINQQ